MLTVWCVYWGDKYHKAYVYALREAVAKNLTVPHQFKCLTDQHFPGIETITPPNNYHAWWSKINLFAPKIATGPSLYFDLDVVITGNLDYLAEYTNAFSAPANWAQSGHGGIQSSVMAWPGNWHLPYQKFYYEMDSKRLWGDQEFLWELLGDDWQRIPGVYSYKYHCRPKGQVPKEARVLAFHGKPDPEEVTEPWILPFTQTLNFLIKSDMRDISKKDS